MQASGHVRTDRQRYSKNFACSRERGHLSPSADGSLFLDNTSLVRANFRAVRSSLSPIHLSEIGVVRRVWGTPHGASSAPMQRIRRVVAGAPFELRIPVK